MAKKKKRFTATAMLKKDGQGMKGKSGSRETVVLSHFSRVRLSATPWTMACQAPLSMGFSRQEHWSGLPFPSPAIKYEVSEGSEVKLLSRVRLFATPWTVTSQAPPSMGFSRQEYWSGVPFPSPERPVKSC